MSIIGVISDTHGLLRDKAIARFIGVDHIIHAGDIGRPDIIPTLQAIAPVSAIRGNIDVEDWCLDFPETAALVLFGKRIFVIHDRNDLTARPAEPEADVIISGHSHQPGIEMLGQVLFLNPGSAGRRRFRLPVTVATLEVREDTLLPTIHTIS